MQKDIYPVTLLVIRDPVIRYLMVLINNNEPLALFRESSRRFLGISVANVSPVNGKGLAARVCPLWVLRLYHLDSSSLSTIHRSNFYMNSTLDLVDNDCEVPY